LFVLLFACVAFPASAQLFKLPGHTFTAAVSTGMLSGVSGEILYVDDKSDDRLSQLDWEIRPLFYAGFDFHYAWQSKAGTFGLFSDFSVKFGIPGNTGVMEDRDWIYEANPNWLTLYSVHENTTKSALLIDYRAGMSYRFVNGFGLKAFVSYGFMRFSWEGSGGSWLYPGSHGYWPPDKVLITYEQSWHIFSPGAAFFGEFNRFIGAELSFKFTPLIFVTALDTHIERNLVFTDKPSGGYFIEPGLVFSLRAGSLVTLSLSYSYRYITGSRGPTTPAIGDNTAGAAYSSGDLGLGIRFAVF
jgi:outer membrane protease